MPCIACGRLTIASRCIPCRRNLKRPYGRVSYTRQNALGRCHICGLDIQPGTGSRDHLTPLSIASDSVATLPAHRTCNYRRGARW